MLTFEPTPNNAGILLWGDYPTLKRLYQVIHRVVHESSVIADKQSFILGLAYDVRKAYERQRELTQQTYSDEDVGQLYGVNLLWPKLIAQVGVLRAAMAYINTNKLEQATIYEFEFLVESALRDLIPDRADYILQLSVMIGSLLHEDVAKLVYTRCPYFIELPPNKRLSTLPTLLRTFDPMYETWVKLDVLPKAELIPISKIKTWRTEWPPINW